MPGSFELVSRERQSMGIRNLPATFDSELASLDVGQSRSYIEHKHCDGDIGRALSSDDTCGQYSLFLLGPKRSER